MDGAWLGSVDLAIQKARRAAMFKMDDNEIARLSQPGGPLHNNDLITGGRGGYPVVSREGRVVGAVGVAGGVDSADDHVANAGSRGIFL